MWELKFKRKPKPEPEEFKEKLAYVPQTVEHAPKIPSLLTTYSNHISKVFNDYCTEMGVSVRIGMNPADYNRTMWLKVVGNRDVQVDHRGRTYYLAPGEDYTFTISDTDCMTGRIEEFLPRLTLMPYGNSSVAFQQNANPLVDLSAHVPGWQNFRVHQGAVVALPGVSRAYFPYLT